MRLQALEGACCLPVCLEVQPLLVVVVAAVAVVVVAVGVASGATLKVCNRLL